MIVKKVINKISGKNRKFFPVVNEKGIAEKPCKFFPLTERKRLFELRRQEIFGNGTCKEQDF